MRTLIFERNLARFAASRVASSLAGSGRAARVSPLRLTDSEPPPLPGPGWYRVRPLLAGICGSDLATVDGRSSRYFEDLVSFPFVPGHEVVGELEEPAGARVVVQAVIGCVARGIEPPCEACAEGRVGGCERVAFGHLSPGIQIGYCSDTGGGWSAAGLVAHESQLHAVADDMGDEEAVMIEPTACAVHAALASKVEPGDTVAVLGAGTLGLTTLAALRSLTEPGSLFAGAKHEHQRRWARELGADAVLPPDQLGRAVRRRSRSLTVSERSRQLTGGADVVVDCVGSTESLAEALAMVRPRGRVVLVGMPGKSKVDLASLWHREVVLTAAYAYGVEQVAGRSVSSFELAAGVVSEYRLGRLVSALYPLERFEEALEHAGAAGSRGAVKIAFDLRRKGSAR
ncbi:MAG TPA: zinc-binding dehydrogenase [Acidimicrobiales bacterium]|nr:zinc-binding dehydrogenase [Acidimicrobiales bacterium]